MNPLQMSEAIPAENEMIKVLDTSLMQVQESFLALCDSLLQSLEQLVHSKQSRDDVVGLELDLQIRRLKEDIYLELKRWKETKHVFFRMCEDYLNSNRFEDARNLADNGGVLGNVYDELLCRYLPLLLGCFYLDDELVSEVLCLDIERAGSGNIDAKPLGCTVLDPLTGHIIPANLGGRMRAVGTGEIVPISGVKRDETVDVVVPYSNLNGKNRAVMGKPSSTVPSAPEMLESLLRRIRSDTPRNRKGENRRKGSNEQDSSSHSGEQDKMNLKKVEASFDHASEPSVLLKPEGAMGGLGSDIGQVSVEKYFPMGESLILTEKSQQQRPSLFPSTLLFGPVVHDSVEFEPTMSTLAAAAVDPVKINFTEIDSEMSNNLENLYPELLQMFAGDDEPDSLNMLHKLQDDFISKTRTFQQELARNAKVLDAKHQDLVAQVNVSDLDVDHKDHLIAEMERQKRQMDRITEFEHARQMKAFQQSLIVSAQRRYRRIKNLKKQSEGLEDRAGNVQLPISLHAAYRMQVETLNNLEDQISATQVQAAMNRLEEITKEQEEVLEALAACAGSSKSLELEDKILGQYDNDISNIETVVRQNLIETTSQLSADAESELERKLYHLKTLAGKVRAKQLWSKVRNIVRTGFISLSKNSLCNLDLIQMRQSEQFERLTAALDEQEKAEKSAFFDSQSTLMKSILSEADVRRAKILCGSSDNNEREQLLNMHASDMDDLLKRLEMDKQRRLQDLETQISARKKMKIERWQHEAQRELDCSGSTDTEGLARQSQLVQLLTDQEMQRIVLLGALRRQDRIEMENLEQSLGIGAERQLTESDVIFLSQLKTVDDEQIRSRLITAHEQERDALKRQLESDINRQLQDLQAKLDDRRKKKIDRGLEVMHTTQLTQLEADGNSEQFRALQEEVELLTRQEVQKAKLVEALTEAAKADLQELIHSCRASSNILLANTEVEFVARLESQDISERDALIKSHEENLELIRKRLQFDKICQLETLEQRLMERRQKKENELADMQKLESEVFSAPEKSRDSEITSLKIDVMLQHEIDSAQLATAAVDHGTADLKILLANQNAQQQATLTAAKAKYLEDCKSAGDSERESLMKRHELDMARLKAECALNVSKAEQFLQEQLANRRSKKKDMLREKQDISLQIILNAEDKSAVIKELELVKSENAIEIEFEKKSAAAMMNIVSECESEKRLLSLDFKHKAEQVFQNAQQKLAYDLGLLDASSTDSQQRRAKLLKVRQTELSGSSCFLKKIYLDFLFYFVQDHEDTVQSLKAQLELDEARQVR